MNTEYVIIPICIPNDDCAYLKVSDVPVAIWSYDDETGRTIDIVAAEQEAVALAAQIYGWKEGKLNFVYGVGTAGGIGDERLAKRANEKLINKLRQSTRGDYYRNKY